MNVLIASAVHSWACMPVGNKYAIAIIDGGGDETPGGMGLIGAP